jgi:uncharacterized protein YegP (UPF0339 family)
MPTNNDRVTVYQGQDNRWYWRRQAGNGENVAVGGQGYASRQAAEEAARRNNPGIKSR